MDNGNKLLYATKRLCPDFPEASGPFFPIISNDLTSVLLVYNNYVLENLAGFQLTRNGGRIRDTSRLHLRGALPKDENMRIEELMILVEAT